MLRVFKWVGICVAVLVVGVVSRPFLINVNQFKPMLESDLRSTLTRTTGNGATAPARCHDASTRSLRSDPQAGQMQATCASAFRPRAHQFRPRKRSIPVAWRALFLETFGGS